MDFFLVHPGGGTGRHAGLKILFPATGVTVQFRSRVLNLKQLRLLFCFALFCICIVRLAGSRHFFSDKNIMF